MGGCGLDISIAGCGVLEAGDGGRKFCENDHLFCVNRMAQDGARGTAAMRTADGLVMFDAARASRRGVTKDDGLIANQVTDVVLQAERERSGW